MPLRVNCQCGAALNVPDGMEGKRVKCPKCGGAIAVPAGGGASAPSKSAAPATTGQPSKTAATAKPSPAKAASVGGAPAATAQDAMGKLLDSAGLKKREGRFCPSCDRTLPPGAAICVGCGYHVETGTKLEGFEIETKEFGNKQLVEAADMMAREADTEKRLLKAGMPWWMMLAVILGILFMMSAILLKMDAKTSGTTSGVAMIAKLQRAAYGPVIAFSLGGGAALIAIFAWLALALGAFKEDRKSTRLNSSHSSVSRIPSSA